MHVLEDTISIEKKSNIGLGILSMLFVKFSNIITNKLKTRLTSKGPFKCYVTPVGVGVCVTQRFVALQGGGGGGVGISVT